MHRMAPLLICMTIACDGDKAEDTDTQPGDDTQSSGDTNTGSDTSDTSTDSGGDSGGDSGDSGDTGEPKPDSAAEAVEEITSAAEAFLASLSKEDQGSTQFDMDDPARKTWSNLPLSMYPREGILTGDLDESQLALAYSLLETSLSSQGYTQALNIIAVDQWHADNGDTMMGEDLYSISIFGEPSTTEAWSWQFDGHHLAFTFTVKVDQVAMSPSLWGVNPLTIPDGEIEGLRALGDEVDAAFALLGSLSEDQQAVAVIHDNASPGLFAGPGNEEFTIPEDELGLSTTDMSVDQRELLMELTQTFVLDMEDTHGGLRLAEIEAGIDDLYFAWMGPSEFGSEIYFRIYGPTVIIELDHVNGNDHIHSVYRDPENDYGEGILAEHYARFPHGP
jgi:hypothetical protein